MTPASSIERVHTPHLTCERLRMEHVAELSRLLLDPRVSRTLWPISGAPTEGQVIESTVEKQRHWERYGYGLWLLRDRTTGEMVGRGGLQRTYIAGLDEVEVGWAIIPERWGEGLATEMAGAAVEVAFGPLGLREIIAFALPDNLASRRVMEKTGFEFERDIVHGGLPHVLYRRRAQAGEAGAASPTRARAAASLSPWTAAAPMSSERAAAPAVTLSRRSQFL